MAEIDVDNGEVAEVVRLVAPTIDVNVFNLNQQGWADWRWRDYNQRVIQLERKTVQDCINMSDIEEQLRDQKQRNPDAELRLLIEGVMEPHPGGVLVYSKKPGSNSYFAHLAKGSRPGLYAAICAWEYQVNKFCEVYHSVSYADSAARIISMYKGDQEPKHTTFERYFKPMVWHPNPQVVRLLGLTMGKTGDGQPLGIGVELCQRLIIKFGTVWAVASASPEQISEVVGISKATAVKFLRAIGRMDV